MTTTNEISAIQSHDEWYKGWENYIRANYYQIDPDNYCSLIKWDCTIEKWFMYSQELGYYQTINETCIDEIFFMWADDQMQTSQGKLVHAKTRLKAMVKINGGWNQHPYLENILDGLINRNTLELQPHSAAVLFNKQIPRHYHAQISWAANQIFQNILHATDTPERLHRYLVAIVHNNHDDEMFLMLYGKKGAGKSTLLQIPELLFGPENISKTPLQRFGARFGLSQLYDKRVNIHPDLSAKRLTSDTISTLKNMTGKDGYIEVEKKGVDSFKHLIQTFLCFGANQLMQFDKDAAQEIESIMRRACLCQCRKTQIPCPAYKDLIADPEFLDEMYSELLRTPYAPIRDMEFQAWIELNMKDWLSNCDPIIPILKELYGPTGNMKDTINAYQVKSEVEEALKAEGYIVPEDLLANITEAFKTMKVYKDEKRGPKSNYLGVGRMGDEENPEDMTPPKKKTGLDGY